MDLIYTDTNRVEQGVLQNFDVDFDCTNTRDFQITVGINNNVMQGGSWWYIEGTEYGGKVDAYKVLSESGEIRYTGRNFRGILTKKIIEPPAGEDYRIVSGNLQDVVGGLIANAHLQDIFIVDKSSITVSNHKINRYVSLYDGICTIAKKYGLVPAFKVKYGKVHISFYYPTDYTNENEYTQDDLKFSITKTFSNVNHLICLGQGELKDRTVIHLYADKDGNVSEKQSLFGIDEVVDIYENTNAENVDELKTEGIQRMNELKNTDSFDVTAPDITLKIGDIIGGMERVTNTYVAREIVNIIARISDNKVDIEYKVGEDDTASKSSSGGSSSSGGGGGITLRPASKTELGGIIVGDGLNVNEDGKLSAQKQTDNNYSDEDRAKLSGVEENANNYSLPTMSGSVKGGAKVGSWLTIDGDQKLHVTNVLPLNYSTDEQVVGTWIDGKPLYQKTIQMSYTPTATHNIILTDIPYDYIQILQGSITYLLDSKYNVIRPTTFYRGSTSWSCVFIQDHNLIGQFGQEILQNSPVKFTLTMQYTKTTD